ncbi:hypothetical protein Acr_07g0000620 [Actinidia rufa]|uniref:Uncharacterized protein n=1 Tax=Actinidia rufa TaxID=165716 RepID=A0A7J0ETN8_9ERIC|nr:hypothetical protein Acr_07g0000620 [Actinidia rufa]
MEVGVALDLVAADDFHSEGYRSGLQEWLEMGSRGRAVEVVTAGVIVWRACLMATSGDQRYDRDDNMGFSGVRWWWLGMDGDGGWSFGLVGMESRWREALHLLWWWLMIFATGVWSQCSKTLGRDGFKVLLTLALSHIVVDWSWWNYRSWWSLGSMRGSRDIVDCLGTDGNELMLAARLANGGVTMEVTRRQWWVHWGVMLRNIVFWSLWWLKRILWVVVKPKDP